MMKIIYFDCFSGISGDMILGALVDAGLDIKQLSEELAKLKLTGFRLIKRKVKRHNLAGTKVNIIRNTKYDIRYTNLKQITALIDQSKLDKKIKDSAREIFKNLARAERKVHGQREEHFHEIGSIDTIVDIVGAVIGLNILGIEKKYSSPLVLGRANLSPVSSSGHGILPTPSPATLALTVDWPCLFSQQPYELVTPTGAAILTTISEKNRSFPVVKIVKTGYGAGARTKGDIPNFLRVVIGETVGSGYEQDKILVVEASIDDTIPLTYEYLLERLYQAGVLEAYISAIQMKKTRPGVLVTVLTAPELLEKVSSIIFAETSTLGIRYYQAQRQKLPRKISEVKTKYGIVKVKLGIKSGKVITVSPEYEDCKKIAKEKNIPLRIVYEEAKSSYKL